ncbi:hypothetical protein [Novosphingobium sp. YAF33]|uniref:hypothetical protein n=1 Tax=Novosphingobium sp. YAF33 TaxID=3233082 RepID=UPI003F97005B
MKARSSLTAAAISLLLWGCATETGVPLGRRGVRCELSGVTTVLIEDGPAHATGSRLLRRWDLPNDQQWDETGTPTGPAYQGYLRQIENNGFDGNPAKILKTNDTFNNRLVASHLDDWMKPASCLEKRLLLDQHERLNMISAPTEFAAFALLSSDQKTVRVYIYTVNRNGIGKATPLTTPVGQDVRSGWIPLFALHNHPFVPGDKRLNGAPAPSVPDADFQNNSAKYLGLPEARITNGVDTAHIPASAFATFRLQGSEEP